MQYQSSERLPLEDVGGDAGGQVRPGGEGLGAQAGEGLLDVMSSPRLAAAAWMCWQCR